MKLLLTLAGALALSACAPTPPVRQASQATDAASWSMEPDDEPSVMRGAAFAQANCATCHSLSGTGASPLAAAPPLREISRRYPVEQLGEAFAEGFVSTHSTMPEFVLDAKENRDLLVYLESIQTK